MATASAKDTFEAETFGPNTFASGAWRGSGVAALPLFPGDTTFLRQGPGDVTFSRQGPGGTTFSRQGPGNVTIAKKQS